MKAEQIEAMDLQARVGWTYLADPAGTDTWRSHADDALAGRRWQGDCDDLASTVLDLAGRAGAALADRYRLEVSSACNGKVDHLVGCIFDDAGAPWIVGDTFLACYPAGHMEHQAIRYNRLSECQPQAIWREGKPWA